MAIHRTKRTNRKSLSVLKSQQSDNATTTNRDRTQREGVTLRGIRLNHAQRTASEMNLAAASINELAKAAAATMNRAEADALLVAIENVAAVICRKCDVLAAYLGDTPGYGNFAADFEAIRTEQATRIEAEATA